MSRIIVDTVSGMEVPVHLVKNYFIDTPTELIPKDPYDMFVDFLMNNLGYACKVLFNIELMPYQQVFMQVLFNKTFPFVVGSRGAGKSFLLALYACLRAVFTQGSHAGGGAKVMFTGASYRQSTNIFNYIKNQIYPNSPLLRQAAPEAPVVANDKCRFYLGNSSIMALPLGDGQKIRGERATHIIADEWSSTPEEIFNIVIRGFAAVSSDPVARVKEKVKKDQLKKLGHEIVGKESMANQIIIAGTMYYKYNHFFKKMKLYEAIIENKITPDMPQEKIIELARSGIVVEGSLDYKDYAVLKLPKSILPLGVLDEKILADAAVSMPRDEYLMEYECIAPDDSDGFFKRSLIDSCETLDCNIEIKSTDTGQYVLGLDPARKNDNFGMCILKLTPKGSEFVFATSLNRVSFPDATRKIRQLLRQFNVVQIAMDSGGGGLTIQDLLVDALLLGEGDQPIYAIDDEDSKAAGKQGRYILDVVNFTPKWIADANFDLKSDLEHKRILFPKRICDEKFISSSMELTLAEDAWENIKHTKNEMTRIVSTATPAGNLHFDVNEIKGASAEERRKDRYSALLLAAYAARKYKRGLDSDKPKIIRLIDGNWADKV